MLKNKFPCHTIAFLTIALASILLYPAGLAGFAAIIWIMLAIIISAALVTLMTK